MQVSDFKPLSDAEYATARRLAHSLEVCPTCGGKEKRVAEGFKTWQSPGYQFNGEHHDCDCQLQLALHARYLLANIGTQYQRLDWEDYNGTEESREWVAKYLGNWRNYLRHGFGLTFASKMLGVGKTWAATHIGKELIKQHQKVYFVDFIAMVNAFAGDRSDLQAKMCDVTFLLLDDIRMGISERQNELYADKFEEVIRYRTNYNFPTIFTTNLTEEEFAHEFDRIYSLLVPKTEWISLNGADHRRIGETKIATEIMIALGETSPII